MELDRTYTDINEANEQVQLLINEKNQIIEHYLSRTCQGCKHLEILCDNKESLMYQMAIHDRTFSCNKWGKSKWSKKEEN